MKVWNKDFNVYFILLMNDTNILRPPRKLLLKMVGLMLELASLFTRVFTEHLGIGVLRSRVQFILKLCFHGCHDGKNTSHRRINAKKSILGYID